MDESLVKHFDQVRLKLSDAIRIGAKMRPKCYGEYFSNGGSCAIGAAYEGMTGRTGRPQDVEGLLPELFWCGGFSEIGSEIVRRNDVSKYTREEIADWLQEQGL